jgi:integrase
MSFRPSRPPSSARWTPLRVPPPVRGNPGTRLQRHGPGHRQHNLYGNVAHPGRLPHGHTRPQGFLRTDRHGKGQDQLRKTLSHQPNGADAATDRARPARACRARGWTAAAAGRLCGKDFEARRDTAIVMFLLDTGAHRGELADLQLTDLDLDLDLDVALVLGKGRRERALPYGRKTAGTAPRGERRTVTLSRTLIASVCRPRGGDRDRGRRTPSKTGSRTARRR